MYTDEIIYKISQVIWEKSQDILSDNDSIAQDIWDKLVELDVVKNFSERHTERLSETKADGS